MAQRKLERLLYREDYRRAFAGDIGDIIFPPRAVEFYTAGLERSVNAHQLRQRAFKVVLDYSFGSASMVMPSVLAKLGAEVLAVNPYASTASASAAAEEQLQRARGIAALVRSSGSALGLVVDPDGEAAIVIDDAGRVLSVEQAQLALITLVVQQMPGARIGLPVCASRAAERIAAAHGAEIVWLKLSAASLMAAAKNGEVDFVASHEGGFIWPDFLPAFDATATLAKLLDLLESTSQTLSSVVDGLPESHIVHRAVPTPWERKGTVMRTLVEEEQGSDLVLVDGVKVSHGESWTLVIPDQEAALTHIWAEGDTDEHAATACRRADAPSPRSDAMTTELSWLRNAVSSGANMVLTVP